MRDKHSSLKSPDARTRNPNEKGHCEIGFAVAPWGKRSNQMPRRRDFWTGYESERM